MQMSIYEKELPCLFFGIGFLSWQIWCSPFLYPLEISSWASECLHAAPVQLFENQPTQSFTAVEVSTA